MRLEGIEPCHTVADDMKVCCRFRSRRSVMDSCDGKKRRTRLADRRAFPKKRDVINLPGRDI